MSKKVSLEIKLIFIAGAMIAGSAAYRLTELVKKKHADVTITTDAAPETTVEVVSAKKETKTPKDTEKPTEPPFLLLDINFATADELTKLNGIGEHLAAEIVAYREEHGRFLNVEELTNVSGIGEATIADIREHIFVTDPVYTTEVQTEKPTELQTELPEEIEVTEPSLTLEDVAPIDLNTADAEMLTLLPHVSDEAAAEIVELREKLGSFSSYYELLYVSSLSEGDVSEIREYVTVEKIDE